MSVEHFFSLWPCSMGNYRILTSDIICRSRYSNLASLHWLPWSPFGWHDAEMEQNMTVVFVLSLQSGRSKGTWSLDVVGSVCRQYERLPDWQTQKGFLDFMQLQEAAFPSEFATWHWWSACLLQRRVSPHVCARRHNRECVSKVLTTSLVCFCLFLQALASFTQISPFFASVSLLTGIAGKRVESCKHQTFPLLHPSRRSMCRSGDNAHLQGDNRWLSLSLCPRCTVFIPAEPPVSGNPTTTSHICRRKMVFIHFFPPVMVNIMELWLQDVHTKTICTSVIHLLTSI